MENTGNTTLHFLEIFNSGTDKSSLHRMQCGATDGDFVADRVQDVSLSQVRRRRCSTDHSQFAHATSSTVAGSNAAGACTEAPEPSSRRSEQVDEQLQDQGSRRWASIGVIVGGQSLLRPARRPYKSSWRSYGVHFRTVQDLPN